MSFDSDAYDDIDDDDDDQSNPQDDNKTRRMRQRIRELKAAAAAKKTLEDEVAGLRQQLAITGAGLDLDDVKRKALVAAHSGEWNPDAVRVTAVALGWAEPPKPDTPPAEVAGQQQLVAAQTGGTPPPTPGDDEWDQKLASAKTEKEFLELYAQTGRPFAGHQ